MRKVIVAICLLMLAFGSAMAQVRYGVNAGEGVQIDYSNPKVFEVADIKFTGLNVLDERALTSFAGIKVGDRIAIPGRQVSDAIKKLWNQGIIADVQFWLTKTEGDRAFIEVRITERPRILRYRVSGVGSGQASELEEQLNVKGKVASSALIKNSELVIKKYYIEKGFLNVAVKTEQNADSLLTDGVGLNFIVDTKGKVKINKIEFDGNEAFDDGRLKKALKNTKEKPRFWLINRLFEQVFNTRPNTIGDYFDSTYEVSNRDFKEFINDNVKLNFLKSSKFIEAQYKEDKNSLINFYNSKGYRDAEVVSDSVTKLNDDFINLDIKVDEGSRYYIRDIDWVGNFKYTDEFLTEKLGIEKGDVYNRQKIEQRTQFDNENGDDIMSLYQDDGYLFFSLEVVEVRAENDSIDLEMRMYEGEQATIKRIILKGNDRTSDHVVLREIRTLPGQKYSRRDLIRTIRELGQLGYFDPEQINPQPIPNIQEGTVDIIFTLVEKSSDQIQLSGGFGGPFGFVGTVGLSLNNFSVKNIGDWDKWRPYPSGDGQKLSLQVQSNGRRFRNYSMVFSEPWLGGRKPNNFTVSLNRTVNRSIDFFNDNEVLGFLKATGFSVGLGRRLTWPDDYFQVQNSIRYQLYEVSNFGNTLGFTSGRSHSLTFNTTISRSNIDQPTYPSYGSQFTFSINATPPWSVISPDDYNPEMTESERYKRVEYHKWMLDYSMFLPLGPKFVFNARAHLGFIGTYSSRTDSGPFERFLLGGNGLNGANNFIIGQDIIALRGYEDNVIDPVDPVTGFRGGIIYNKFTAELRYPVSKAPTSTIYLLAFGEAGNAWIDFSEYSPRDLFRSAGVGARVFLPAFGLLGIDWAYGFDSDDSLSPAVVGGSQVHFTIGQQIR
ncbi:MULTISPECIES: POTRA domain-containing protein [Roseivirga]|uniref:Outer membrane protein assembly factor BamA n=1 Tax=Roseivirga spongicola TaxID=333140 RepID=A0A150XIM0_9BACT|nr:MULTISPECIES: POTRA domain-containing protein [Roseivirga]PWL31298.1 MAG: outer membrane protein assembly factor BamA [Roseivirga sp. XM-24bin3]KYG78533.1 outer membrane protein assembly factor BamA [Roseivirga spongicola]MBO6494996.1 BamA/TamA family outer membrane protein [Roseivirga sp.]MBO6661027.1 BamA/TamA family outer membrane protein [Roseivirga sp.]MBO6759693.1 BamA/TamA family outer membrane protein [Roseivirga sp.]